jgi:hypothetical protein
LRELSNADVRFMVVGAFAVGFHGRPRATKELDAWIEPSEESASAGYLSGNPFGWCTTLVCGSKHERP